ncbi:hypothetical protein CGRA01v4_00402 [Colletotrichum graminicola]|nr:hypothetical protein CGRA01v4_00402 [Colletotrichum graminicola]
MGSVPVRRRTASQMVRMAWPGIASHRIASHRHRSADCAKASASSPPPPL